MIRGKFGVPTFRVFICALKRAMSARVVSIVVFTVFLHCLMNNAFAATEYLVSYDKNGNPLMHPIGNHRGKPLSAMSIGRPLMTNAQKERRIGGQGRI